MTTGRAGPTKRVPEYRFDNGYGCGRSAEFTVNGRAATTIRAFGLREVPGNECISELPKPAALRQSVQLLRAWDDGDVVAARNIDRPRAIHAQKFKHFLDGRLRIPT